MPTELLQRGFPVTALSGVTTGTSAAYAVSPNVRGIKMIVKGSAGISAGAVQLEEADDPAYAGVWAAVGGPLTAIVSADAQTNSQAGPFRFVRARVSTNIVGGTVDVILSVY